MIRLAFLTSETHAHLHEDDRPLVPLLEKRGIEVSPVVWSRPEGERDQTAGATLIRTPWDYSDRLPEFLAFLEGEARRKAIFYNPIELIRWNLDKRYLLALEAKGIPIVPTAVLPAANARDLPALLDERGWIDVVAKPTVAASAKGLRRFSRKEAPLIVDEIAREKKDMLVQPFDERVVAKGELSFVFFDGAFSHAVRKRPPEGDFRAQEHLGGTTAHEPTPKPALVEAARRALLASPVPSPLYARVDALEAEEGLVLMELELIEPLLYLSWAEGARERFADAIHARVQKDALSER